MTTRDLFENVLTLKRTVWSKRGDRVTRREVEKASTPIKHRPNTTENTNARKV